MDVKWKVCGLRDNIKQVASLMPDFMGFIFYPKSPRYVGTTFVMPEIKKPIKKVGVFVNEPVDKVFSSIQKYNLDYAQLHGHESPGYCTKLRRKGVNIIKAFQVDESFDFEILRPYQDTVNYFLFDTKSEQYGGSGITFNWQQLKKYSFDKQYFLSGGISLENIEGLKGVDQSKVFAIDVNSKFENRPGFKDVEMLKQLKMNLEV